MGEGLGLGLAAQDRSKLSHRDWIDHHRASFLLNLAYANDNTNLKNLFQFRAILGRLIVMDAIDRRILTILLEDARTPYARIAKDLGMATATVHQRVKRLRQSGVISRFTVSLDWSKLGLPVVALVSISVASRRSLADVGEQLRAIPWVVGCGAVSGQFDLLVHVRAESPAHLGEIIDSIRKISKGTTQTVMVLSPYFEATPPLGYEPPEPDGDGSSRSDR